MKRHILPAVLAIALVAVLGGCTTRVVTTDGATPLYTVTASGTGTTAAAPDVAELYFGVTLIESDAKTALEHASDIADAITAAVKNEGVADEDIQTANVSVYPQYTSDYGEVTEITGYSASVQIRVKLRDFETIGDVIMAASSAGANQISGPSFTLSDDAEARATSIELAIDDARAQAQVMAEAAGKSLGDIVSIGETGVTVPTVYRDIGAYDLAESSISIEPGQLDVTAYVTVVFELK